MLLFLDHNVPDSVARVFAERGHEVVLLRETLPTDSPDQVVATVSERMGAVLVSCDTDFARIAPRIPRGHKARFRRLSRISLACRAPQAARRVDAAMTLIEHEYEIARSSRDGRMHLVISDSVIRTHR